MENREYTREELELLLCDFEFLVEKAKEQIKELEEKEEELNKEYVIEIPEQGLYLINEGTMDRFDVRVYPRRSGKTIGLVKRIIRAEKDIEVDLVLVLGGGSYIENLIRDLPEEVIKSKKYRRGSFFRVHEMVAGFKNVKIFYDEISQMSTLEFIHLMNFVKDRPNISLLAFTS